MKQTARIIRNNVPLTLLPNGTTYGEPIHVPTVAAARLLPDPPPPAISIGSSGVTVSGTYYWDSVSVATDDGQTVIKVTAIATGRYIPVSIVTGGGGSGTALSVANPAALKAVLSTTLTDTQPATIQTPGTNWVWSSSTGAGFESDDLTVIRPTNVLLASNGRWYNTSSSPVVPTLAALRLAVSGKQPSISVQARSSLSDSAGGIFDYDASDTTSTDNDGTIIVAGTRRYKRRFHGPIDARWFGCVSYQTAGGAVAGVDSTDAINAALRAGDPLASELDGFEVLLPYGKIKVYGTIEISREAALRGHGAQSTELLTLGDLDTIQINEISLSSDGGDGAYASVRDLKIRSISTGTGRGIWVRAPFVEVANVLIVATYGVAIQIGGATVLEGGNSHYWHVSNVRINSAKGSYAFLCAYGNGGAAYGIKVLAALHKGIGDTSNLGSGYFGCGVEASEEATYSTSGGTNRSCFVGCYAEGAESEILAPAQWIGQNTPSVDEAAVRGNVLMLSDAATNYPMAFAHSFSAPTGERVVFRVGSWDGSAKAYSFGLPGAGISEDWGHFYRSSNPRWSVARGGDAEDLIAYEIAAFGNARKYGHFRIPNLLVGNGGFESFGARVDSGDTAPSAGIWRRGDQRLNTGSSAVFGWRCTTEGAWSNTTRTNLGTPSLYDLIEPTAGHVWECTTNGVNAGSSPVFTPGPGTVTDGTTVWTYVGPEPPVFEVVYAATQLSTTRVLKGMPFVVEADADVDEYGRIVINTTAGTGVKIPVEVPDGATLTGLTLRVIGGGNASLPAVMPGFRLRTLTLSGNSTASNGPQSDGSANVGVYNAEHTIAMTGLSSVIDNAARRYVIEFFSESGANATTGYTIIGATATFTPASPDRGAS